MKRVHVWIIMGLVASAALGASLFLIHPEMIFHASDPADERGHDQDRTTGQTRPAPPVFELTDPVHDRERYNPALIAPQLADALYRARPVSITIDTYTDTFDREIVSTSRTQQWAAQMELLLTELGANSGIITATAHGETGLAVTTPDGIPEPANRRVVIVIAYE